MQHLIPSSKVADAGEHRWPPTSISQEGAKPLIESALMVYRQGVMPDAICSQ